MGDTKRFGEEYRRRQKVEVPADICELCGEKLEVDPETGECHCLVCEDSEE